MVAADTRLTTHFYVCDLKKEIKGLEELLNEDYGGPRTLHSHIHPQSMTTSQDEKWRHRCCSRFWGVK